MGRYIEKPLGELVPGDVVLSEEGRMVFRALGPIRPDRRPPQRRLLGQHADTGKRMGVLVEASKPVFCERDR